MANLTIKERGVSRALAFFYRAIELETRGASNTFKSYSDRLRDWACHALLFRNAVH